MLCGHRADTSFTCASSLLALPITRMLYFSLAQVVQNGYLAGYGKVGAEM